ncbi:glycosyltransferase [Nakamurella silvestris]|nr:glycosyltransferase [Nakamurella silvestris]
MRVLFTFAGGTGHFLPLVPFARALAHRGHQVAVSCQPKMLTVVQEHGFPAIDSGGNTLADAGARTPLVPPDRAAEEQVVRTVFAGRIARERAGRLTEVLCQFGPDVIVRDEVDFGAMIAAERSGIPQAVVVVLLAGGLVRPDLVGEPLDELRVEFGLPVDPQLALLRSSPTLYPAPAGYRSPDDPLPATARPVRPAVLEAGTVANEEESDLLDRLSREPETPVVYFTLGTVFHTESGDLFARTIEGLRRLKAQVVVTVGREIDPAEVGQTYPNVHVAQYLRQELILPRCDLLVSHAGSGSVMGALAFGVPMVLLPMGADQPLNSDRCLALGVAAVMDPVTATGDDIRATAEKVLSDERFRENAKRIGRLAHRLDTAAAAASMIEGLIPEP